MPWPLKAARPAGLADVTPRAICPKAKSPGGGCLLPLWACWGGRGPAVCPWGAGRLGKGHNPWQAVWRGWLAEGEPEHPGVVGASLCKWVLGPSGMQAEWDTHPACLLLPVGLQPTSSFIHPVRKQGLRACMCWLLGYQAPQPQHWGKGPRE